MFLELSSPSACCIVNGFPRICLELVNLGHSSVMCLIVSALSQSSQVGLSSFVMRCRCVRRECPIRVLVVTTSSCLDEDGGVLHGSIDGLIFYTLLYLKNYKKKQKMYNIIYKSDKVNRKRILWSERNGKCNFVNN